MFNNFFLHHTVLFTSTKCFTHCTSYSHDTPRFPACGSVRTDRFICFCGFLSCYWGAIFHRVFNDPRFYHCYIFDFTRLLLCLHFVADSCICPSVIRDLGLFTKPAYPAVLEQCSGFWSCPREPSNARATARFEHLCHVYGVRRWLRLYPPVTKHIFYSLQCCLELKPKNPTQGIQKTCLGIFNLLKNTHYKGGCQSICSRLTLFSLRGVRMLFHRFRLVRVQKYYYFRGLLSFHPSKYNFSTTQRWITCISISATATTLFLMSVVSGQWCYVSGWTREFRLQCISIFLTDPPAVVKYSLMFRHIYFWQIIHGHFYAWVFVGFVLFPFVHPGGMME